MTTGYSVSQDLEVPMDALWHGWEIGYEPEPCDCVYHGDYSVNDLTSA
jgi:hypothetical protein